MAAVSTVLVRYGADPAIQDADGDTPLSLAESDELRRVLSSECSFQVCSVSRNSLCLLCLMTSGRPIQKYQQPLNQCLQHEELHFKSELL